MYRIMWGMSRGKGGGAGAARCGQDSSYAGGIARCEYAGTHTGRRDNGRAAR